MADEVRVSVKVLPVFVLGVHMRQARYIEQHIMAQTERDSCP
jgi:hypothetical protein